MSPGQGLLDNLTVVFQYSLIEIWFSVLKNQSYLRIEFVQVWFGVEVLSLQVIIKAKTLQWRWVQLKKSEIGMNLIFHSTSSKYWLFWRLLFLTSLQLPVHFFFSLKSFLMEHHTGHIMKTIYTDWPFALVPDQYHMKLSLNSLC